MHDPVTKTGAWVKQMLQGHLNYYAVSGNHPGLWWFCNQVRALAQDASAPEPEGRSALGALHQPRRSLLSADQDTTPAALSPFRRQDPREESGALAALAGIRAGGGEQSLSLPRPCASPADVGRSVRPLSAEEASAPKAGAR
jgi:hypothetical protein